jgi:Cu(I)-responsive transcriptional regulator
MASGLVYTFPSLEGQATIERSTMNIGEVSRDSGVPAKMIRYYESIGLIPAPRRAENGYRTYSEESLHMLRFVRRARDFGFSMAQIKALLRLWSDRSRPSRDVKKIALEHVAALDAKIARLTGLREALAELAHRCRGDRRPDCPILTDLADPKSLSS